CMQSVEYPLTF
nr:immunoglobulin light chain junction region [Macaca mulatta]MOW12308.1 immunoglobulin light chain junction region [Macaca mulatta]MOX07687.1 immunoglobulin light chain junction region [Macaca mulatta]MOX07831.1 immunoglobulin light chain junction region [Macaca mulatta]MOX09138.1 immunoglobulin light chain junction region [Macaca mulatta]